jgi:hypothetical protein
MIGPLYYWATLRKVVVKGSETDYSFDGMKKVTGKHYLWDLFLANKGKKIARKSIRPYAICKTPEFLKQ